MDKEATAKVENDLERKKLTIRYERALGQMSIRFSLLHSLLEELGWKIWGLNKQVGPILTKDLPTKQLVNKIRDSTDLLLPKDASAELNAILNRVEKVAVRRNEFLHSVWAISMKKGPIFISRKRGILLDRQAPTADDILDLSRNIMKLVAEFMKSKDGKSLSTRIGEMK
jgi:hypothetical protein